MTLAFLSRIPKSLAGHMVPVVVDVSCDSAIQHSDLRVSDNTMGSRMMLEGRWTTLAFIPMSVCDVPKWPSLLQAVAQTQIFATCGEACTT
jgi:hypothetical protein